MIYSKKFLFNFLILFVSIFFITGCGSSTDDILTEISPVISSITGTLSDDAFVAKAPNKTIQSDVPIKLTCFLGDVNLGEVTTDSTGFFKFNIRLSTILNNPTLLKLVNGEEDFSNLLTSSSIDQYLIKFKAERNQETFNFCIPPTVLKRDQTSNLGEVKFGWDSDEVVVKMGSRLAGNEIILPTFDNTNFSNLDFKTLYDDTTETTTLNTLLNIASSIELDEGLSESIGYSLVFSRLFTTDLVLNLEIFNLTENSNITGKYTYVKYTEGENNATVKTGTYSVLDNEDNTFTFTFAADTSETGGLPSTLSSDTLTMDYSSKVSSNFIINNADGSYYYINNKINGINDKKFAITDKLDGSRTIIDYENNKTYYWEYNSDGEDINEEYNITDKTEIPGGYSITEDDDAESTTVIYPLSPISERIRAYIISKDSSSGYQIENNYIDPSKDLSDYNFMDDGIYLGYFNLLESLSLDDISAPRKAIANIESTILSSVDELHIMKISDNNISDEMFVYENNSYSENSFTFDFLDEYFFNIYSTEESIKGIMTNYDECERFTLQMLGSDNLIFKLAPFTSEEILSNPLGIYYITSTGFSDSSDTYTFNSDGSIDLRDLEGITKEWSIDQNGVLLITTKNNDIVTDKTYIYKHNNPETDEDFKLKISPNRIGLLTFDNNAIIKSVNYSAENTTTTFKRAGIAAISSLE